MKTKLFFGVTLCLLFSSCIKDHIGHGPKDVELTSENHLYSGYLFLQFAAEETENLDALIDKLKQISPNDPGYDQAQKDIQAAEEKRGSLKQQSALIEDIYTTRDIPRPCPNDPGPNGKCVPVRLEYFIFPSNIINALVSVANSSGENEGVSDELVPLPGFESDLQFIRVPVEDTSSFIKVSIMWKDIQGEQTSFDVVRSN